MITVKSLVDRAMTMLGRRTVYWAGAGGFDPAAASAAEPLAIGREWPRLPAAEQAALRPLAKAAGLNVDDPALVAPACDCSGFVCWALGVSRHVAPGGAMLWEEWINTDSIWRDATRGGVKFRKLPRATPGCLVVYPQEGSGENFGHVALVTQIGHDGHASEILHCSAVNFSTLPADAIKLTAPDAFARQPKSIYAWSREVSMQGSA